MPLDSTGVTWSVVDVNDVSSFLQAEHYLGPLRSARLVIAGSLDGAVVAATVWRRPTSRRLPKDGTWLELSRWCLTPRAGINAGSRSHAASVRILRTVEPLVRTLVSYSDPAVGHRGELYRACNWLWAPSWLRLRPPPTANGNWGGEQVASVKDRWVFPLRRDDLRGDALRIDDPGAIRTWLKTPTETELRLAALSPAPDLRAAALTHRERAA